MPRKAILSTYEAAILANDAYIDSVPKNVFGAVNWSSTTASGDAKFSAYTNSGFFGRAYFNHKQKVAIIAYRGSEDPRKNMNDWITNAIQFGAGLPTMQFKQAKSFSEEVIGICKRCGYRFMGFTGHSLGGGLAALMALEYKSYAVTFNPAPIRQVTRHLTDVFISNHVVNFVTGNDYVSRLNPFIGIAVSALGAARMGILGIASSVMMNSDLIGEASAALTVDTHTLIPGITYNVSGNQGHGIGEMLAAMHGKKEYLGDIWPTG